MSLAPSDATLRLIAFLDAALADLERAARWHVEHGEGECAVLIANKAVDTRRRFRDRCARMGVLV